MKKFMLKRLKNEKGMTLIELLAVIVILAIIAAIAIPAIGNIIENSRVGAMKSDATNALNAAQLYLADNPKHFETSGVTDIDEDDLVSDYLDSSSSFSAFSIEEGPAGLIFTGDGLSSGIELKIKDATKGEISDYANNNRASVKTVGDGSAEGSIQAVK